MLNTENLTAKGLKYVDEDGNEQLIPRANIEDGYKYTQEQEQRKEYLMQLCIQKYESLDKCTIEIMVDYFLSRPDEVQKEMESDKEYMMKFK